MCIMKKIYSTGILIYSYTLFIEILMQELLYVTEQ